MAKLSVADDVKIQIRFEGTHDTPAFLMSGDRIHFETVFEQRNKYLRLHGEIERLENDRQILRAARDKFERWWRAATEELEAAKKAQAAILGQSTNSHWRDISTAPKDESHILMVGRRDHTIGEDVVVAQWGRMCERWCIVGGDAFVYPTHWMPLPAAPVIERNPGTPKKAVIEHWRDISTAPKDGSFMLGRSTNSHCRVVILSWNKDGGWDIQGNYSHAVTHWMPLPKFEPKGA